MRQILVDIRVRVISDLNRIDCNIIREIASNI